MSISAKTQLIAILIGLAIWVMDAAVDSLFFYQATFWQRLWPSLTSHDLYIRTLVLGCVWGAGIVVGKLLERMDAAKKALSVNEQKWQSLVASALTGIYQITPEGKFAFANPAMVKILGYDTQQEVIANIRDISDVYVNRQDRALIIADLKRDGFVDGAEVPWRQPTGKRIWVRISTRIIKTDEGKTIYEGVVTEITEAKQAQEKLLASENRYRNLVEMSPEAVLVHRKGIILLANTAARKLLGGENPSQILGCDIYSFFLPLDREKALRRREQLVSDGQSSPVAELRIKRLDGHIIICETSGSLINFDGEPAFQSVLRNVTNRLKREVERIRLEAQLRQAQKMEAIGTLAGGIAHDFNNILAVITGYTELALASAEKGVTQVSDLKKALGAAGRAGDLVKQILTFSRRGEPELTSLDLNQKVRDARELLSRTLPKMISIKHHLSNDLKPVKGDANQLEQVFMNLASNAADAMPDGGTLAFETKNVVLDQAYCRNHLAVVPGPYVLLKVSDTGIGMDRQTLKKIFDPFFTTKEVGKGTGLGMSTVFGIIKSHNGHINCHSNPGEGFCMEIYLPVAHKLAPPPKSRQVSLAQAPGGQETILLVDDEIDLISITGQTLELKGYSTLTAHTGEEAIALYQANPQAIDLVVMDISMPGMGGHNSMRELLKITPNVKVIIASGYTGDGQLKDTLAAGAAAFIAKPFGMADLLQAVREVLDR